MSQAVPSALKYSLLIGWTISWVIGGLFTIVPPVFASHLDNAQDIINNEGVSAGNVEHSVVFTLPLGEANIASTDYIHILLANFSNITAPTSVEGTYFGTPSFSVSGQSARVTGIIVTAGNQIQILGITATNPPLDSLFQVTVIVSEDADGLIIKNISTFTATPFSGNVAVTTTIIGPYAYLSIAGYSSPGSFVTVTEDGTVIGTTSAGGSNGVFSKFFVGLVPAQTHSMTLYGVDLVGRTTSPLSFDIFLPIYQTTSVTNVLLSPTIQVNATSVVQGTDLVTSGSAVPNGTLSIFTQSPLRNYSATANSSGDWDYTITDTNDYIPGDYRLYSLVQSGALQSLGSTSLQFTVLPSTGPTPTAGPCSLAQGDLNCDTDTNLTDFSILMYYWGSTNVLADINSDNLVNLVDFSIMMYYWGT